MNIYFLTAGILCFVLGIVHSILGEYLIFHSKRKNGSLVPSLVQTDLKERHLRIIWATWHLVSVFGWCIGTIIIKFSLSPNELQSSAVELIVHSIIYTMLTTSALVLIATKGKHPGWIVLLIIGVLLIVGNL